MQTVLIMNKLISIVFHYAHQGELNKYVSRSDVYSFSSLTLVLHGFYVSNVITKML